MQPVHSHFKETEKQSYVKFPFEKYITGQKFKSSDPMVRNSFNQVRSDETKADRSLPDSRPGRYVKVDFQEFISIIFN